MKQTIREMQSDEVDLVIDYFLTADHDFLRGMGADPAKLPQKEAWRKLMLEDLDRPLQARQFYYLLWEMDGIPIGHSNINHIEFGVEAKMHLHLWQAQKRRSGNGTRYVSMCIARYFERFKLQRLICEPYAHNPAPNRTLARLGFELVRQYETTPGWINFEQEVNRWLLTRVC